MSQLIRREWLVRTVFASDIARRCRKGRSERRDIAVRGSRKERSLVSDIARCYSNGDGGGDGDGGDGDQTVGGGDGGGATGQEIVD